MAESSTIALNLRQIEILDWIKNGCPDGVYGMEDTSYRISARVLANKGLVKIAGRGPAWTAVVTARGSVWPGATQEDERVRDREKKVEAIEAQAVAKRLAKGDGASQPHADRRVRSKPLSDPTRAERRQLLVNRLTQQLIDTGEPVTLDHEEWDYDEQRLMESAATRSPNRPYGQVLTVINTGGWKSRQHTFKFVKYLPDFIDRIEVIVPERVSRYHPSVRKFMEDKQGQWVSSPLVPRAARILNAIVSELERRGYKDFAYEKGSISFLTTHGAYGFHIREQGKWGDYLMYEECKRLESRGVPAWQFSRNRHYTGSGTLSLRIGTPERGYDNEVFKDGKIQRVENRLTDAFFQFELRLLQNAEHVETERQRKHEEQRKEQEAQVKARIDYVDTFKKAHFAALMKISADAAKQRTFLNKALEAAEQLPEQDRDATLMYLREMEAGIDSSDPLLNPEIINPGVPEPSDSELEPFLQKYRPARRFW